MDIVDKAIGVFIIAALVPSALLQLNNANTTGFSDVQLALWALIGILVIVGIIKQVSQ